MIVNKLVGNRIIPKRIHVRLEHIRPSKCREAFVKRIQVYIKLIREMIKLKLMLIKREKEYRLKDNQDYQKKALLLQNQLFNIKIQKFLEKSSDHIQ